MLLLKSDLSKTHMEQLVESNFFEKFKVIASVAMACTSPIFQIFFLNFSENTVKLDMGI